MLFMTDEAIEKSVLAWRLSYAYAAQIRGCRLITAQGPMTTQELRDHYMFCDNFFEKEGKHQRNTVKGSSY